MAPPAPVAGRGSGVTPSLPRLNQPAPNVQQDSTMKIRRQTQSQLASAVQQVATAHRELQRRHPQFAQFAQLELTAAHHPPPAPTAPSDIICPTTPQQRVCTTKSPNVSLAIPDPTNPTQVLLRASTAQQRRPSAWPSGQRRRSRLGAWSAFAEWDRIVLSLPSASSAEAESTRPRLG